MMRSIALLLALLAAAPAAADTLPLGGVTRTFELQLPDRRPAPLVIVLHGSGQQGRDLRDRSDWPAVARHGGFAVVFPDGIDRAWADLRAPGERARHGPPAGTDDVAFLLALADKLVADGVADPKRIYVTGVSNGGAMTLTLACLHPERFAAAASVVMAMTRTLQSACTPRAPLPMLLMNGTSDPLVAYAGGTGSNPRFHATGLLSSPDTLRFWRHVDGCDAGDGAITRLPDTDPADGSTVTRIESRCPPGTDVVLVRVDGGGHRMPGASSDARADRLVTRVLGPQNHDIDGPEVIWEFLSRFARK